LLRLDAEALAACLQVPAAMARRLHREAQVLQQRVGETWLDPEEAPDGMIVPIPEASSVPMAQPSALNHLDRSLIQAVLGSARSSAEFPTPDREVGDRVVGNCVVGQADEWPGEEDLEAIEEHNPSPMPLAPTPMAGSALVGAVDGLDRAAAAALGAAGVGSLQDLVEHDANLLARATGINFSRIRRLQFLARREGSAPRAEVRSTPVSEPLAPREPVTESVDPAAFVYPEVGALQAQPGSQEWVEDVVEQAQPQAPKPTLDLVDHPVFEFEPQSGGPMVVAEAANAGDAFEDDSATVPTETSTENPAVAPLGRWLPRAKREAESMPTGSEAPQPVLVPPPPPRRFWEPKRFWEARKNRREKAAANQPVHENENMPLAGTDEQTIWQAKGAPEPQAEPQRELPSSRTRPTGGALGWDFTTPGVEPVESTKRGFSYPEPESKDTREDAAGPFA